MPSPLKGTTSRRSDRLAQGVTPGELHAESCLLLASLGVPAPAGHTYIIGTNSLLLVPNMPGFSLLDGTKHSFTAFLAFQLVFQTMEAANLFCKSQDFMASA